MSYAWTLEIYIQREQLICEETVLLWRRHSLRRQSKHIYVTQLFRGIAKARARHEKVVTWHREVSLLLERGTENVRTPLINLACLPIAYIQHFPNSKLITFHSPLQI